MIGRLIAWLDRWHARRDERHRRASTPPRPAPRQPSTPNDFADCDDQRTPYRVLIVPALADPTAPTVAELEQGIDLTDHVACAHPHRHRTRDRVLCEPHPRWICTVCGASVVDDKPEESPEQPTYAVGDRVKVVCGHWPGQAGGLITSIEAPRDDAHDATYRYWIDEEQDWFRASCLVRADQETDRA